MSTQDQWVQRWTVRSETSNAEYTVARHRDGHIACNCRGWLSHRKCKHATAIEKALKSGKTVPTTFPGFGPKKGYPTYNDGKRGNPEQWARAVIPQPQVAVAPEAAKRRLGFKK